MQPTVAVNANTEPHPLEIASRFGRVDVLRNLLSEAHSYDVVRRALSTAARKGFLECVQLLCAGADNRQRHHALCWGAADAGQMACVQFLLENTDMSVDEGETLAFVVYKNHIDIGMFLLDRVAVDNAFYFLRRQRYPHECIERLEGWVALHQHQRIAAHIECEGGRTQRKI